MLKIIQKELSITGHIPTFKFYSDISVIKMNVYVPPGQCISDSWDSLLTQGDQLT